MAESKTNKSKTESKPKGKKISRVLDLRGNLLKLRASMAEKPRKLTKLTKPEGKTPKPTSLRRSADNPIIEPSPHQYWESKATFNPSAVYADGKVHLIYRAIGEADVSVLGYASSKDGLTIDERSPKPAFFQSTIFSPDRSASLPVSYSSGGGWNGGCEDPRLTKIDDRVYMLYTSFDGWSAIRIALTSISFDDFIRKRWYWSKPVFISPPGTINKNWVLFPEKIKGKYAILHGISPRIGIDYVKALTEFDGTNYIRSATPSGKGNADSWDTSLRGVGPAPIKTEYGWLVLYHAMDVKDPNRYKLGAMLLDLAEPTKIIAKAKNPVLEPDEWYENEGFKSGVVYACGAAVVDDTLFVYYGGADKVVCVASANLPLFLKELISSHSPKITRSRVKAITA
ncbi:MAG: glycosidase [bacterium]|nr:glycosidase [bacterium]